MVAGAPLVALAHENGVQANAGLGLHLGSFINHNDNDADDATTTASSTAPHHERGNPLAKFGGSVVVGTVSAVNGTAVTLADLFGTGTTPVSLSASTTFVGKGHQATTSAALAAGEKVVVFGQNVGGTIEASLVKILNGIGRGLGHIHWNFWAHANASAH